MLILPAIVSWHLAIVTCIGVTDGRGVVSHEAAKLVAVSSDARHVLCTVVVQPAVVRERKRTVLGRNAWSRH
jgi:hypothetical protein